MKKYLALMLALVMAFSLAIVPADKASADDFEKYDDVTIRLCMSGTEQGVDYISAEKYRDDLLEKTGGRVKLELYASNILAGGSMAEAINMLTQGDSFEMGIYSAAVLGNLDQQFLVWMLPFIFDNYQAVDEILDSTGDEWMAKKCKEYGLIDLNAMHCGLKQWTNNKEEKDEPDDFKNFKMRIPGGEVSMAIWKALGADPVSMPWSEVYTALQQGTVDGHENGYQTLYSNNIQEVQKYITEANYQYDGYWLLVNEKFWDTLNADTQQILRDLGWDMVHYGREYLEGVEADIKQELIDGGTIITELTPEQKQAFIDATKPVLEQFYDVYGAEAYEALGIKME